MIGLNCLSQNLPWAEPLRFDLRRSQWGGCNIVFRKPANMASFSTMARLSLLLAVVAVLVPNVMSANVQRNSTGARSRRQLVLLRRLV